MEFDRYPPMEDVVVVLSFIDNVPFSVEEDKTDEFITGGSN